VVRRGTYPLAKPNVGHEAKRSIRFAKLVCVGAEEHFKHSDHVSCHFPAVITSAFSCLLKPASVWIRSFGQSEYCRTDARFAIRPDAVNQEIGLDRKRNPGDRHFRKPGGISGGELSHAESVFCPLE
jgi:hypothetical protein